MPKLQILMPMGGLGSRFADAGYDTPKPLIDVDGQAMFLKAASSLDSLEYEKTFTFVIRQEHVDEQKLDTLIKEALPEATVVVIPKLTRGAAETALAAESVLDPNDALVVMDCDLWFQSDSYNKMVVDSITKKSDIAGGLLTFPSDNPRYSYAKVDENDIVTETAEKRVISEHAITGACFFASAQKFIDATHELLKEELSDAMPEYYISYVYNVLIKDGGKIQASYVNDFASFGTPDELDQYNKGK